MKKKVLCVGNCDADHARLVAVLTDHFSVDVLRANHGDAATEAVAAHDISLVLVNREFFHDGASGTEWIRRLCSQPGAPPAMLISNFESAQAEAVGAGAVPGFGKAGLTSAATHARLAEFLPPAADAHEKSA
ncbi:MAG: response regulator [Phycisphaerae bacterium]